MELKYCDDCGAVLSRDACNQNCPEGNPDCKYCRGSTADETAREENPDVAEAPDNPHEGATAFTNPDSLELFSEQSIAMKRQSMESQETRRPTEEPRARSSGEPFELPADEALDLFSAQTLAVKKQKYFSGRTASTGGGSDAGESARIRTASVHAGSQAVRTGNTRIQFRCLHCRSKLEIRAIQKLSKLVCPRCSQTMYIEPSGKIHASKPKKKAPVPDSFRTVGSTQIADVGPAAQPAPGNRPPKEATGSPPGGELTLTSLPRPELATESAIESRNAAAVPNLDGAAGPGPESESAFLDRLLSDMDDTALSPEDMALVETPPPLEPGVGRSAKETVSGTGGTADPFPDNTGGFDALPPEQRISTGPRHCLHAFLFGCLLCAPLLTASLVLHAQKPSAVEASRSIEMIGRGLDSLGGAVERAYEKLYSNRAD